MGCSDHSKDFNIKQPHSSDTAQHLISNYDTTSSSCSHNTSATISTVNTPRDHLFHTCCTPTNFLALNHHYGNGTDHHHQQQQQQSRTEFSEQPLASARWNPTPEQLLALEELYRQGTRTPTAEQIQQIAAKLRRFGKIEGKNVFYWFQNHKARERQKRRRQMETVSHDQCQIQSFGKKDEGVMRRTGYEFEQIKSWIPYSNCRKLMNEELNSKHGQATEETSTGRTNGWTQFQDRETSQQGKCTATWQNMKPSYYSPVLVHAKPAPPNSSHPNSTSFSSFKPSYQQNYYLPKILEESEKRDTQTLELFPLHSSSHNGNINGNKLPITALINTNITPSQYFEFLPLKN